MHHENGVSREWESEAEISLAHDYVVVIVGNPFISRQNRGFFSPMVHSSTFFLILKYNI